LAQCRKQKKFPVNFFWKKKEAGTTYFSRCAPFHIFLMDSHLIHVSDVSRMCSYILILKLKLDPVKLSMK